MAKVPRVVALIPLRGGSKSIPLKNIRLLAGKPLCAWVIHEALKTPEIDEVWVSTDDKRIKTICLGLGAKVLDRPAKYATDTASTESVMLHFSQKVPFDLLVTIQATVPFTTTNDLSAALRQFESSPTDSLVTVTERKKFFWNRQGVPINHKLNYRPRRQEMVNNWWLEENGAFYITQRKVLEKYSSRFGKKVQVFILDESKSFDIDEPADWEEAARRLKLTSGESSQGASKLP